MSRIPDKVNELLKEYFDMLEPKLPDYLEAFYIYGSVSLGAFDFGYSDIDFIAVVKNKVTEEDMTLLKQIHGEMHRRFPKTDLMGMYVMGSDLEAHSVQEETCPCFINGKFHGFVRFDRNSIDAYQLKKYGIVVFGWEIEKYGYNVDWDVLMNNMRNNLNTYWLKWKTGCEKFPSLHYLAMFFSLKAIEWGVLGVTRLYYTFREKDITSKVGAGEYALRAVPERWHRIINESMRLRKGIKGTLYKSVIERRNDALGYINFIIQEGNKHFEEGLG
ncbi:MAG TPA: aminoglycoside adenylyltransferase domain-containing protein [Clostridia bacterium]|nr:aminoglycoside adenylyltransferase domain-containing protein [Clostridia bacterium]